MNDFLDSCITFILNAVMILVLMVLAPIVFYFLIYIMDYGNLI